MNKSHEEFMKDVKQESSLYGQSNKDMNCESDEDKEMYEDGIGKSPFAEITGESNHSPILSGEENDSNVGQSNTDKLSPGDIQNNDVVYTEGEVAA